MLFVAIQSASIFSWVILVMIVSTIHEGGEPLQQALMFLKRVQRGPTPEGARAPTRKLYRIDHFK